MDAKTVRKKSSLGRGLSALLDDSGQGNQEKDRPVVSSISNISLTNIDVNPFQPRTNFDKEALEELADSIKTQGIIQPITVRAMGDGQYQLISGERRVQASKLAGLTQIPAYIRTANDQQMLEMALIENIQRENLNAIEIALSYQRLISECDLRQEQLGERVGKNRTTVNNYLRLLKLPPEIQVALRDTRISMGHARAIINVESVDNQLHIFEKTVEEDLSVRKVEELVRNFASRTKQPEKQPKKADEDSYQVRQLQSRLSSHFGTKVQIKGSSKGKGEIKIPYLSNDDLTRILEMLGL
jgi:ParB family transcriptional regulator, chromosome partitioning protein